MNFTDAVDVTITRCGMESIRLADVRSFDASYVPKLLYGRVEESTCARGSALKDSPELAADEFCGHKLPTGMA